MKLIGWLITGLLYLFGFGCTASDNHPDAIDNNNLEMAAFSGAGQLPSGGAGGEPDITSPTPMGASGSSGTIEVAGSDGQDSFGEPSGSGSNAPLEVMDATSHTSIFLTAWFGCYVNCGFFFYPLNHRFLC